MSTRARITFIAGEEGYRLKYSKHWDGYPYAVLGSLPAGTFTIEDLIKRWGLTEEPGGFTDYYYEFDFRNKSMKIWGADKSEFRYDQCRFSNKLHPIPHAKILRVHKRF